ncbi:MAG: 50S ribosomal protein L14e [Promethearchaeota archaeon]
MLAVYSIGRVCVKNSGREAGRYAVVVDVIDKNYVLVDGPRVRRRRCNVKHLEPTSKSLELKKGAELDVIVAAAKKAKLAKTLQEKVKIQP